MNLFIMAIPVALASLWVAMRYKNPGAIGFGGAVIALYGVLTQGNGLAWIILLISASLFVIGMLVNRAIDDFFHWGALLVNAFQLLWSALIAIFGWGFWRQTSQVPTAFVVVAIIAILAILAIFIWWLTRRTTSTDTH